MESILLDLRKERCPMALLLAKRHAAEVFQEETQQDHQLVIQVVDKSSKHDIVKYLRNQGYIVDCQASPEHFTLTVFNKESSYDA
ncbi:sulfurtransferase TusA family protein [Vibrio harveyi]|uniref:sulfurtransferase TusA family protein n=1 Tax=Vibrio harveyi TaxID=669 RepID=UPI0005395B9A|nr:sulfurtransferase TusA family protein [Vibrio harveyi]AIV06410.1 sirA-like family protein [Vibrio harveyi]EKO3846907.1 sulfurtransferase TusA family protein [Vibrio harveyi]EKO3853342.1 sulfurtransferase TusA family protein [Vibrio harveyi]MCV3263512.1 sulfurtransferase TusA family protein [Vibrio harveyi]WCP81583.1 sulfurtransferase TusA family protein [Vibrio harveyi]